MFCTQAASSLVPLNGSPRQSAGACIALSWSPRPAPNRVVIAESIGSALLVVLDVLGPAERVAFVLHDVFAVPFDDLEAAIELAARIPAARLGGAVEVRPVARYW
jgi:hypothetical protein